MTEALLLFLVMKVELHALVAVNLLSGTGQRARGDAGVGIRSATW